MTREALWARCLAAGLVEWRPGMLVHFRYGGDEEDGKDYAMRLDCDGWGEGLGKESSYFVEGRMYDGPPVHSLRPEFDDDATRGAILGMARAATGRPDLTTVAGRERDGSISWEVECIDYPIPDDSPDETHALLAVIATCIDD